MCARVCVHVCLFCENRICMCRCTCVNESMHCIWVMYSSDLQCIRTEPNVSYSVSQHLQRLSAMTVIFAPS